MINEYLTHHAMIEISLLNKLETIHTVVQSLGPPLNSGQSSPIVAATCTDLLKPKLIPYLP